MRVLVVDDDIKIASFIKKGLQEESYSVDTTQSGDEAIYLAQLNSYDVILLDIMLIGTNGMNVCKTLRANSISTPIIMLTARNRLEDKIDGLDMGADDYLTKPFAFEELLARIRVQLRNQQNSNILTLADLSMDTSHREVRRQNRKIRLTNKEYALLEFLLRNKRKFLSETVIKDNLNDMNSNTMSNIVNVYIYRLRNKIDKEFDLKLIHTIRGLGYIISDEDV
jgi:DNA-binding response OmpR family regulator